MNKTFISRFPTDVDRASIGQFDSAWRGRFSRAGLAMWRALEAYGHARAQRELRDLHDRWELSDPSLGRELRGASRFLVQSTAPHR